MVTSYSRVNNSSGIDRISVVGMVVPGGGKICVGDTVDGLMV